MRMSIRWDWFVIVSVGMLWFSSVKAYQRRGGKAPPILSLGTRWRRGVSVTIRPSSLPEKSPVPIA
jgi:hypothetical protein